MKISEALKELETRNQALSDLLTQKLDLPRLHEAYDLALDISNQAHGLAKELERMAVERYKAHAQD